MKVLGTVGSPRKNGNTDLLGSRILDVTNANNNLTEKLYLYEFEIFPCVDCRGCKKNRIPCSFRFRSCALLI